MARERTGKVFEREKGVWYARVTFTDQSGKRRDVWRKGQNKSQAKELLKGLLRKIDSSDGSFIEGDKKTLNEYLDKWLDAAAKPRLAERTYTDYRDLLERYVRPAIGNKKLSKVQPLDVQALYSEMQGRGLSPRVVR
jgi:integrase